MSERADIVVVGGGGSALAAAAEAAGLGRKVIVLEKNASLGGATALSAGLFMAVGSRLQKKAGIDDSPERYWAELEGVDDEPCRDGGAALARLLVEHCGETADVLARMGVDMVGPLSSRPCRTARLHAAVPGGRACVAALVRRCRRLDVDIRTRLKAEFLVKDGARVAGVEARDEAGKFHMFLAGAAVILATGDFSANSRMLAGTVGAGPVGVEPMNPAATGDGHRMALTVGARLAREKPGSRDLLTRAYFPLPRRARPWAVLPLSRPVTWGLRQGLRRLPDRIARPIVLGAGMTLLMPSENVMENGAILVDRSGDRCAGATGPELANALARAPRGEGFLIFDEMSAGRFSEWPDFISAAPGIGHAYLADYRRARPDLYTAAETLVGLAARLSLPADRLVNAVAGATERPQEPPFHALGPLRAGLPPVSVGLVVDNHLRVLNTQNQPIPGLYAAGLVSADGMTNRCGGEDLAWAFTSGRIAGRCAAGAVQ